MKKIGFSTQESESMDIRQVYYILDYENELKRKQRVLRKLDIAEAFNMAYVGSQGVEKGKANKGATHYKNWRNSLVQELDISYKKLTVWPKKTRKF